ncbi:aspartic peptidase domain-containing protein [Xylariales sp. PMI_506]|nr:aspartic peptidase domain-containing protein [Xylariales sp. PMI_506]
MVYASTSVILTTGLVALAAAAPAPAGSVGGHRKAGVSVHQVRSNTVHQVRANSYVKHGPTAMAKALTKFGKAVPTELAATVQAFRESRLKMLKRTNGSAVNTPEQYDSEYLTPVEIGTPAQTLNLDFDTGSSDLWVFSSLTTSADVNGQTIYTPTDSTSAALSSGSTWDISYGDGSSSSGVVYTDTVTVGGVTFASQAVEAAKTVSSSFTSDSNSDGLLGLAFSTINTVSPNSVNTFFANVQSNLTESLFTADLKYEAPGTYNFGWIDTSLYTGTIAYTDVDSSSGYWGFTATGYSGTTTGAGTTTAATTTSITGIADTGTTLALLPTDVCEAYYAAVSGATYSNSVGGYVFACDATLADFSYTVGANTITIPGQYLNYSPVDTTNTTCYGGIQPDTSIGFSIFGDVALKAALVVFKDDGTNTPQLGFASKAT